LISLDFPDGNNYGCIIGLIAWRQTVD